MNDPGLGLVGALSSNLLISCGEHTVDRLFHLLQRLVLHSGNLGDNQLAGTVKHLLFAKGKTFLKTQGEDVLQDIEGFDAVLSADLDPRLGNRGHHQTFWGGFGSLGQRLREAALRIKGARR